MTAGQRILARCGVSVALATLAALATALTDGAISALEVVTIASSAVGALGVYLGVGAATPMEPNLGPTPES